MHCSVILKVFPLMVGDEELKEQSVLSSVLLNPAVHERIVNLIHHRFFRKQKETTPDVGLECFFFLFFVLHHQPFVCFLRLWIKYGNIWLFGLIKAVSSDSFLFLFLDVSAETSFCFLNHYLYYVWYKTWWISQWFKDMTTGYSH